MCQARQFSDQMICGRCALSWDTNDPDPPACPEHQPKREESTVNAHAPVTTAAAPQPYQVAGDHYLGMGIQPIAFAMENRWDACAFSALKYISRHRRKGGVEDLKKARHFIEMREGEFKKLRTSGIRTITMTEYTKSNGFCFDDANALMALEHYVRFPLDVNRDRILTHIDQLIRRSEAHA